ncbi:MAG: electron transfer flavoprotein subunit beta/FixA family protein [Victivallaceae bacterium]|nr:electron transfer flavoprotein subunit beta/FixA family protein [Victivallaceae bacterium]
MKIIVCIKQVPAAASVRIDPVTLQLIREGVGSVINPFDYHALEAALALRETAGGEVTVLTMGPPKAETALREALALGADRAVLLTDRAFAGSDTWATAYLLSLAVRKLGGADLLLCGKQAIDGDTAQVGPQLAARLGIVQATGVSELRFVDGATLEVRRMLDGGGDLLRLRLPALLGVERDLNRPRVPTLPGYLRAVDRPVTVWSAAELNPDPALIGLAGSPTRVVSSRPAELPKRDTVLVRGSSADGAAAILRCWKPRKETI